MPVSSPAKLSVTMCNFNHGHFLRESLASILNQSRPPDEFIIVDDASTDNSVSVITEFAQKFPNVRLLRNDTNQGVMSSANRALLAATGDYVFFMSADDAALPGLFEKSMRVLNQYPHAGVCTALSVVMDQDGKHQRPFGHPFISKTPCYIPPRRSLQLLIKHGSWNLASGIFRRQALIDAGGLIPELQSFADDFMFQVLVLKHGACFVPAPLFAWRKMENTYSNRVAMDLDRTLGIMKNAKRLMLSSHRGLFPDHYIACWENRWKCGVGLGYISDLNQRQMAGWRQILSKPNLLDRLYLFYILVFARFSNLLAGIFLFLRFRYRDILPATSRRLRHIALNLTDRGKRKSIYFNG